LQFIPQNEIVLSDQDMQQLSILVENLESNEDVDKVCNNVK
jgi:transcriptional/translational regulatory protein YebC/TACO1